MSGDCYTLYAITDGDHVKVGQASYHPGGWKVDARTAAMSRRGALQVGNPRPLRLIGLLDMGEVSSREAQSQERNAHRYVNTAASRALGEWFADIPAARVALRLFGFKLEAGE